MQMKNLFVFLMAVALALPLATAFNCTALDGENKKVCKYLEGQPWSQSEKDSVIQEMIDNGGTLNGNFESIVNKPVPTIQLNKPEKVDLISDDNKKFLIDLSSLSVFGYVIYAFLKSYFLWRFI
ncbi:MAG: hypothetical protein WC494_03720 [Candidatus Pacearchaeota archaeon]